MRLNKFIASGAGLSRRTADALISSGRVAINGVVAKLGDQVIDSSVIKLDGKVITLPSSFRYIALHKPVGYISSRRRQGETPVIYELLPPDLSNLQLAGRLDLKSSGLILLSSDGDFIQAMSHPSADKLKSYELQLDHPLKSADRIALEAGIILSDGLSQLQIQAVTGRRMTIGLEEGRNRQIRRTLGAVGYAVDKLHRFQIGKYKLGDLKPGEWRDITK